MSTLVLYTSSSSQQQQGELALAQTLSYLRSTSASTSLTVIVLSSVGLDVQGGREGEGKGEEGGLEVEVVCTEDKRAWLMEHGGGSEGEGEGQRRRTVVVCLAGEGEQGVMEACAELGIHHLSSNRSAKHLKNTLFRLSYLAAKAPRKALILPMCDVLSVAIDLTTSLHSPPPSSTLLATFVAPTPPTGLLTAEAAQESLSVREVWSGRGIPFPRGVFYQCNWDLEDRLPSRGGSLTSPWHELVNLFSQRERGEEYSYVEEWNPSTSSSLVASLQMNLLLAFVWVLTLLSSSSESTTSETPLPLPLTLTTNTTTTSSSPAVQKRLEIPTLPPFPTPSDVSQQIICSTELALLLLSSSSLNANQGGVLTVSAALGEEGCKEFRSRLEKRGGWTWS